MIPLDIQERMRSQRGEVFRADTEQARAELSELGIDEASQFGEFFLRYKVSAVSSPSSPEELMDLASPSPQIARVTRFAREVFGVPDKYVALTSGEGEGFYLYDKQGGAVYDLDVADIDDFVQQRAEPRWPNFFAFLRWYLSGQE